MEISTPKWLDEKFLASCLSGDNSNSLNVKVTSFQVERGVPVGNNYGSEIFRVRVRYCSANTRNEETISLILKAPVKNAIMDLIGEFFVETEVKFYYDYLPKVHELMQVPFAPKSYFPPLNDIIILEDLKETGFTMADRHNQLDFEQCKQYFTTSAKFHAAGIALLKKHPELSESFQNSMQKLFLKDESMGKAMIHTTIVGMNCSIKTAESLNSDEYRSTIESLKKLVKLLSSEKSMPDYMIKGMELQQGHLKSLVHGDCWTTNMMFKHDDANKPIDIRLLDFQAFSYDAISADLVNFTWMSANNDVLENNLDELYHLYCDTLNSSLEDLGCEERYPYNQLKKELHERSNHIIMIVAAFLPLTQAAEVINHTAVFSIDLTEDVYMQYYQGEHFWKKYPKVLKLLHKHGVFDMVEEKYIEYGLS